MFYKMNDLQRNLAKAQNCIYVSFSATVMPEKSVTLRLKCDGTCAETRFRLSAKRTSPFKSTKASVQSTTGNRDVRISGSNAGYTKFRGSVKGTGYPLHSTVSPSLSLPCITVCHHVSAGLYIQGFGGEPEGRRKLGRPRCGWEDNTETDLEEIEWKGVQRISLA